MKDEGRVGDEGVRDEGARDEEVRDEAGPPGVPARKGWMVGLNYSEQTKVEGALSETLQVAEQRQRVCCAPHQITNRPDYGMLPGISKQSGISTRGECHKQPGLQSRRSLR